MSPTAIALILVAAIAHATWNLFSKQAATTGAVLFVWLLAACAAVIYLPVVVLTVLLGHPHLTGLSWVFLVGSGVLQSGYFLVLQNGYKLGDLSLVYPVGRGSGALLAAVAGIVLLGERPTPLAAAGIIAIVAGIVVIGLPGRSPPPAASAGLPAQLPAERPAGSAGPPAGDSAVAPAMKAVAFALVTGAFIGSYTIWDKYAVSTLRTPPILQGYAAFPVMLVAFAPFALRDTGRLAGVWRSFRPQVLGAALLSPAAYVLILIALSFTAVSAVAPAREVSVLFGVLLGRRLLGEGSQVRRLSAAVAIVAGIIAIAVG